MDTSKDDTWCDCTPGLTKDQKTDVLVRLQKIHKSMHLNKPYGFEQTLLCDLAREIKALRAANTHETEGGQLVESLRKGIKDRDRKIENQRQELSWLIDFMEKRCVGAGQSADAARWELIKIARGPKLQQEKLCGCGEFCNRSIGSPFTGKCRREDCGLPVKNADPAPLLQQETPVSRCHFRAFGTMPCQLPVFHQGPHSCGDSVEAQWETAKDAMAGDSKKAGVPNYNLPPWHLSQRVPGCQCDGCRTL